MVLDSLSEIRLLAQSPLRDRRQVLSLKHLFPQERATALLLDDLASEANDRTTHSIAHGVIRLEETAPDYGSERRRLRVLTFRGRRLRGGSHDLSIETGGARVVPRPVSAAQEPLRAGPPAERIAGHGAAARRRLIGPAGTGKSLLTLTFLQSAIRRGEAASLFVFDKEGGLLIEWAKGVGMGLQGMLDDGRLTIEQVGAAALALGEFSERVRRTVDLRDGRTVAIDSPNGRKASMPGEKALVLHVHERPQCLDRRGVTTFLTVAQHGLVGDMQAPVDVASLADTVILLRYSEAMGRVGRAMPVIKKRVSAHEDTIRKFRIGGRGITLGEPRVHFQGVLRGVPTLLDGAPPLLRPNPA